MNFHFLALNWFFRLIAFLGKEFQIKTGNSFEQTYARSNRLFIRLQSESQAFEVFFNEFRSGIRP